MRCSQEPATLRSPSHRGPGHVIRKPEDQKPESPIVAIHSSGSRPPLFLIHGVGGNVVGFEDLASRFSREQPVYGIQSQALDRTGPALMRVEEIASYYIREMRSHRPKGPYSLLGYSFGGIVAFEMAQQLRALGEQVGLVGLVDTCNPTYFMKWLFRIERWKQYLGQTFSGPEKFGRLNGAAEQQVTANDLWRLRRSREVGTSIAIECCRCKLVRCEELYSSCLPRSSGSFPGQG